MEALAAAHCTLAIPLTTNMNRELNLEGPSFPPHIARHTASKRGHESKEEGKDGEREIEGMQQKK